MIKPTVNWYVLLLLCLSAVCAQAESWSAAEERRFAETLVKANVGRDDEAKLIGLTRGSDRHTALAAIFALTKLPKTPAIIDALLYALNSSDELMLEYAVGALLKLGDKSWTSRVQAALPSIKNERIRLDICGDLARAGTYGCWPLVKKALANHDPSLAAQAVDLAPYFVGMKDARENPVSIQEEIALALPHMPLDVRSRAEWQIKELRKSTPPPP